MKVVCFFFVLGFSLGIGFSQFLNPINIFQTEIGQTLNLEMVTFDSSLRYSNTYEVIRKSGDSTIFNTTLWSSGIYETNIYWENGFLRATGIIGAGIFDTNKIYERQIIFPQDYSGTQGTSTSGYTLNYSVNGYLFDTLLVSCSYASYNTDGGDICDFLTTDGYFAYEITHGCLCRSGGATMTPESNVLEFIGGTPIILGLKSNYKNNLLKRSTKTTFDLRGRIQSKISKNNRIYFIK